MSGEFVAFVIGFLLGVIGGAGAVVWYFRGRIIARKP